MPARLEAAEGALFADLTPALLALADTGRVAVSLGGSRAKRLADERSDYDFRVYADRFKGPDLRLTSAWSDFERLWRAWEHRGLRIDGAWCRTIGDIDGELTSWLAGSAVAPDYEWTIWGYHLPTDIAHQRIIADPDGVLAGWTQRLDVYPEPLRRTVLARHLSILRYWRDDYHYVSKVERGDAVFLAGLSAKLVHSIMQVLFALNRTYFVGDGWNIRAAAGFAIAPQDLAQRVGFVIDPGATDGRWVSQRQHLIDLIDDLERLIGAQADLSAETRAPSALMARDERLLQQHERHLRQ